ncbi:sigma-70 family RNA polymerase sigma factor [Aurantimonas sp. VKM B-3413]|uniref:sigma-70 family RNA polymerase sigma factor n=1 Tax=Aurantimonas sp. VKM B-3413 TaxID=2779401 RepID=UPI001E3C3CC0|nr:sigma-70 family RNA polymerase sigma factor [Aurantimonas sp. VKM B-3413]MCB8840159.1 sigma-70 family RNA polymerase sigma factor [Aurantimonas sp. VKM B-3413]
MTAPADFKDLLLATIPSLRAYAYGLARGDASRADDLTQATLVKAWGCQASFEPGTNLTAWLFTILRNEFYDQLRQSRREVADIGGEMAGRLTVRASQEGALDLSDFHTALATLPVDHREALILVGASGFSYEEAAEICGCPAGTMKSRVSRARDRLAQLLQLRGPAALRTGRARRRLENGRQAVAGMVAAAGTA